MKNKLRRKNVPPLEDPLRTVLDCQRHYENFERRSRDALFNLMALVANVGVDLYYDRSLYCKFIRQEFFKTGGHKWRANRPKKTDPVDLELTLRVVMIFVTQAQTGPALKKAWKCTRALAYLLRKGVHLEHVPAELEQAGGIEKLAREAARYDPRRVRPVGPDPYLEDTSKPVRRETRVRLRMTGKRRKRLKKLNDGDECELKVRVVNKSAEKLVLKVLRLSRS